MSFIHFREKEITFKIVYYGPALCGKTTNVELIHKLIADETKGDITILSTQQDRTLYFDFLPLKSSIIKGYTSKFQIFTVPGQVIYNSTRKLVLKGVDGVVFVADSQWDKMKENVESFQNLEENLKDQGMKIDDLPYLLQYNKRDVENVAPVHYMDFLLNQREKGVPYMEASAKAGKGVLESLNIIAKMVITEFIRVNKMEMSDVPKSICVSE